jgi:anti-anti-sigma regulatory factor
MALSITTSKIGEVIVVHLSGAIYFGEESAPLRLRVKDLLDNSRQIVLDLAGVTLTSTAGDWALLWVSSRRPGRSAVTSSLQNSVVTQKRCCRLQSSLQSSRYSRERKMQPHLSSEPPLPIDRTQSTGRKTRSVRGRFRRMNWRKSQWDPKQTCNRPLRHSTPSAQCCGRIRPRSRRTPGRCS